MAAPTSGQRIGFWLLLGLASTVFAEVLFPTTAFDVATMAMFAVPIYTLHSVVLAAVVYRGDRVGYSTLYLAGVLLALYEAYATKVLWAPLGDRPTLAAGGVYVFETVGLVLFWHPVVSFYLPVVVVETIATASDRSLRPPLAGHRFARPVVVAIVVYLLLFQSVLGGPLRALVGNAVALTLLLVALFVWRQTGGHTHDMRTLLPDGRTLGVLTIVLVGSSIGLGSLIQPAEVPTQPIAHLSVLWIYLVAGGLLALLVRGNSPQQSGVSVQVTWRRILAVALAVTLVSPVLGLVGAPLELLVFLSFYAAAVGVGAASLVAVVLTVRSGSGSSSN